jgi:hypothetical protein
MTGPSMLAISFMPATATTVAANPTSTTTPRGIPHFGASVACAVGWYRTGLA